VSSHNADWGTVDVGNMRDRDVSSNLCSNRSHDDHSESSSRGLGGGREVWGGGGAEGNIQCNTLKQPLQHKATVAPAHGQHGVTAWSGDWGGNSSCQSGVGVESRYGWRGLRCALGIGSQSNS